MGLPTLGILNAKHCDLISRMIISYRVVTSVMDYRKKRSCPAFGKERFIEHLVGQPQR